MPERLECEVLQKERYINTLTFTFTFTFTCRIAQLCCYLAAGTTGEVLLSVACVCNRVCWQRYGKKRLFQNRRTMTLG